MHKEITAQEACAMHELGGMVEFLSARGNFEEICPWTKLGPDFWALARHSPPRTFRIEVE